MRASYVYSVPENASQRELLDVLSVRVSPLSLAIDRNAFTPIVRAVLAGVRGREVRISPYGGRGMG